MTYKIIVLFTCLRICETASFLNGSSATDKISSNIKISPSKNAEIENANLINIPVEYLLTGVSI